MAVKRQRVLSRDEVREALDTHQISISRCAKATSVPRTYLSEFLSIGRPLTPEQLGKIREFLEGEGVEFEDQAPADAALPPSLAIANICHFPVRPDRVGEAKAALDEIDRNDKRIAALLDKPAVRNTGLFGDGDFSAKTDADIRELFALMGANYILFRYLTLEKNPLEQAAGPYTLRSVLIETVKQSLEAAGLDTESKAPELEEDSEVEAA